jgi:hypothetical protein
MGSWKVYINLCIRAVLGESEHYPFKHQPHTYSLQPNLVFTMKTTFATLALTAAMTLSFVHGKPADLHRRSTISCQTSSSSPGQPNVQGAADYLNSLGQQGCGASGSGCTEMVHQGT